MPAISAPLADSLTLRPVCQLLESIRQGAERLLHDKTPEGKARLLLEMTRLCQAGPVLTEGLWGTIQSLDDDSKIDEYQDVATLALGLIDSLVQSSTQIEADAAELAKLGRAVPGMESLSGVRENLLALRASIVSAWSWAEEAMPPPDPAMIEESLQAFRSGNSQTLEDLIREVQGPRPEAP